jgi:DHA1 family bicyclomycin/chloramphenicol resistance-like MFS transporter
MNTSIYKLDTKRPSLFVLIILISLPAAATVFISPALPAMSEFFHIAGGTIQQLMTIFIVGFAVSQLIYSPMANRFGRKPTVYSGLVVYLVSSVVCLIGIYTHTFGVLLIGRLLMGLGAGVGMTMSFTVINDFYYPHQARPIVSYSVLSYSFMPAFAIFSAGFIIKHFSWIDLFYVYFIYGIFVMMVATALPETLHHSLKNPYALKIKPLLHRFAHAFTSWRLVLFSILFGLLASFVYVTSSEGPFIGLKTIGLTPTMYGLLLLIPYAGQLVGALISAQLKKLSHYAVLGLSSSIIVVGVLFIFLSFLFHWINIVSFLAPLLIIMFALPIGYSSVTVMAQMEYDDKATGSSVMSFISIGMALISTFVLTLLPSQNPLMMPLLFLVLIALILLFFWHATRRFPSTDHTSPVK